MTNKKKKLKERLLKPKARLKEERLKREVSLSHMASVIGVDRCQYKLKESDDYPFRDYEILTICSEIDVKPEIFFI